MARARVCHIETHTRYGTRGRHFLSVGAQPGGAGVRADRKANIHGESPARTPAKCSSSIHLCLEHSYHALSASSEVSNGIR